jgi:hypothetical protein
LLQPDFLLCSRSPKTPVALSNQCGGETLVNDVDLHDSYSLIVWHYDTAPSYVSVFYFIQNENIGSFYKFVNKRLSCKQGIGTLKSSKHGEYIAGDTDRANLLNRFFCPVCTVDNGELPAFDNVVGDDIVLDCVEFTRDTVLRAIKKLKTNSACGPDSLPPILLKKLAHCLAEPLALILDSFMSIGGVPDDWRRAIVTPVYKSGLAADVSNYRPISLTFVACKIMEKLYVK